MNAVLYTEEMEPITVVDVPMWMWERLRLGEHMNLQVVEPPYRVLPPGATVVNAVVVARTVAIWGEVLRRRHHETLMLFTRDEEDALQLVTAAPLASGSPTGSSSASSAPQEPTCSPRC